MKEKSFIQIPLLIAIIVSIIAVSGVITCVVLYKTRKLKLTADISESITRDTENTKITEKEEIEIEEPQTEEEQPKETSQEEISQKEQEEEQARLEVEKIEQTKVKKQQINQTFQVGDYVEVQNGAVLRVLNVIRNWESSSPYKFDKPSSPQKVFVLVKVEIENKKSSNLLYYNEGNFTLEDANHIRTNSTFSFGELDNLHYGSLFLGEKARGDIVFEVDKNALSKLIFRYVPFCNFCLPVRIEL